MKRRTLKRHRPGFQQGQQHYHVYVVLLDHAVRRFRKVLLLNPHAVLDKPCLYVGMTGLTPEERFENHKQGDKASSFVKRFGIKLLPELYSHLNPMPFEAAVLMEKDLADDLRQSGYTVLGGH